MIDKRTIFEIHRLHELGMKERKIARHLGISRPTVRKYLRNPDITRVKPIAKPSKYQPTVRRLAGRQRCGHQATYR
jgi:predicted transcriptional regulator